MPSDQPPHPGPAFEPPSVQVSAASFAFAGQPLFEDLSFTLPAERWTCLLGPSGVGKTTLLRLIAGLADLDPGSEVECGDGGSARGRIAYMAQQDLLLPWLSVTENVLLGSRLRGRPAGADERAQAGALIAQVGLSAAADQLPQTLSGGMRQRAALARTLMEDRPIVLMDEPFSGVDPITRYRLQALAAELLAGRTVLLVTHDALEALRLGHEIRVLAGRPAHLDDPLRPAGEPPRDVGDTELLALQGDLLKRLAAADAAANGTAP